MFKWFVFFGFFSPLVGMELLCAMREMSVTATCGISVLGVWECVKAGQDVGGHKARASLAQGEPQPCTVLWAQVIVCLLSLSPLMSSREQPCCE